ncbi:MAG: hypothetical protein QW063_01350 [Candidatus Nanoarchaeia archaeon]
MAKKRRVKAKGKAKTAVKVKFFGYEIVLTFIGSLIIALGAMLTATGLQPLLLTWLLATTIIWLGMLIFLYPIVKKIEDLL